MKILPSRMTLSNAAVAAAFATVFVLTLSFLPEASALPREREAFYKWSPRDLTLVKIS